MDFDNSLFGNKNNEPRLKGKSITSNSEENTIYKGVFTTLEVGDTEQLEERDEENLEDSKEILEGLDIDEDL